MKGRASIPSMRLHRPSGLAVVTLNSKDHYLGPYDDPEAETRYGELIARWLANGRKPILDRSAKGETVAEFAGLYLGHAEVYYRKDGRPTTQHGIVDRVMRRWIKLYGSTRVVDFGINEYKLLRRSWLADDLQRTTINVYAKVVARALSWGVREGIVPVLVSAALREVGPLPMGRSEAREGEPVGPAPEASIEAILGGKNRKLSDMVAIQLLTSMRPGELTQLRPIDIDRSGDVWIYRPRTHKTQHRGKGRSIAIGPRAQAILAPRLDHIGPTEYVFGPTGKRDQKMQRGTYRHVLRRACARLGVEEFKPNQLRHSGLTAIRKRFGLEAGRVVAGHSEAATTAIYAEADDVGEAAKIAKEMG